MQKEIPILRALIQNLYQELDRKFHLNGAKIPITFGFDTDSLGSYTRRHLQQVPDPANTGNASDHFWTLEKRIRQDKKNPGVLIELRKSTAILDPEGNITMNIQIFGTKKCNDTKKAERFFKERGIKYQFVDMKEKGMSKGEFNSVAQANGGLENMINWDGKDKNLLALIKYIADEDKLQKVMENPSVIKTPVVRNGKLSTLGYQPEIWKKWQ